MHKLAVKLEGIERRKRTTGLLHIAAGCFLLLKTVDFWRLQQHSNQWMTLFFFLAGFLSLLYGFLKKLWDNDAKFNRWIRLIQVAAFTILAIEFIPYAQSVSVVLLFAWAIGCLLLMFTERKVFNDAEMLFSREGIFIPGYFSNRRLFWNGVKEVVVRPDYITIFRTDDSFLQYEVLKNMKPSALDEITLYCNKQIDNATRPA